MRVKDVLWRLLVVFLMFLFTPQVWAKEQDVNLVNIYFFHSDSCSHCQSEIKLLDQLEKKYDNVRIYRYEVHENNHDEIRKQVQEMYQITTNGVPLTIIGDTSFVGYSEEKSGIRFVKTIEYYSRYGYEDRVGEFLKIEDLPVFEVHEDDPDIVEFINSYGNYRLIGSIYTDNLELQVSVTLLGVLSQFNWIKIVSYILVFLLLFKIVGSRNQLLLFGTFLIFSLMIDIIYIFSNYWITLGIGIFILLVMLIGIVKYFLEKRWQYLYGNIFIIIACVSGYLEYNMNFYYLDSFHGLMSIHVVSNFWLWLYNLSYLFIIFVVDIVIFGLLFLGKKVLLGKLSH